MVEQCVSNGPKRKEVAKNGKKEKQKTEETETQRRTSDRIKSKQREEKERLVRKRVQILDEQEEKGNLRKRPNANVTEEEEEVVMAEKLLNQVLGSTEKQKEVTLSDAGGVGNVVTEKSATVKVKDTLRLFNKFYLQLVQVFFSLKPLWVEWFHNGLFFSPDFCCVLSVMACFCVIL
jgi:euchromatic histone-lysine N-methyltransferase